MEQPFDGTAEVGGRVMNMATDASMYTDDYSCWSWEGQLRYPWDAPDADGQSPEEDAAAATDETIGKLAVEIAQDQGDIVEDMNDSHSVRDVSDAEEEILARNIEWLVRDIVERNEDNRESDENRETMDKCRPQDGPVALAGVGLPNRFEQQVWHGGANPPNVDVLHQQYQIPNGVQQNLQPPPIYQTSFEPGQQLRSSSSHAGVAPDHFGFYPTASVQHGGHFRRSYSPAGVQPEFHHGHPSISARADFDVPVVDAGVQQQESNGLHQSSEAHVQYQTYGSWEPDRFAGEPIPEERTVAWVRETASIGVAPGRASTRSDSANSRGNADAAQLSAHPTCPGDFDRDGVASSAGPMRTEKRRTNRKPVVVRGDPSDIRRDKGPKGWPKDRHWFSTDAPQQKQKEYAAAIGVSFDVLAPILLPEAVYPACRWYIGEGRLCGVQLTRETVLDHYSKKFKALKTDMGDVQQFGIFKDCLARRILSRPDYTSESSDGDLDDFVTFLAAESWSTLPQSIRELTYETKDSIPEIDALALGSTPISFTDTLTAYGLSEDTESALLFLKRTIEAYVSDASAPPPVWSSTRTTECEICERQVPLTYHHLIPRSTHAKVLKRKWHPQSMLNSVAWICRPCHNVVHSVARGEDLAQNYYTVELLLAREDIQKWRRYAAKQRYGVRRG
ncbi:hypothetical protein EYR38_010020 [Pleurotus pulmonarius]|nr:hypothetical protein EYR38_010020 [Pleurotus pulmonarius]